MQSLAATIIFTALYSWRLLSRVLPAETLALRRGRWINPRSRTDSQ